jgi:hypothetical protein
VAGNLSSEVVAIGSQASIQLDDILSAAPNACLKGECVPTTIGALVDFRWFNLLEEVLPFAHNALDLDEPLLTSIAFSPTVRLVKVILKAAWAELDLLLVHQIRLVLLI